MKYTVFVRGIRMGWLPLALLCLGTSAAQGQDAVDQVKGLLTRLGVKGSIRLQRLGTISGGKRSVTTVEVTDQTQHRDEAYLSEDGTITRLARTDIKLGGWDTVSLPDRETLKRVQSWLAATHTKEKVGPPSSAGDGQGMVSLHFPILRNGYPFVSHPAYGFDFLLDSKSGTFLSYNAHGNPPAVSSASAKLDSAGALTALKTIWDTKITPQAINERHWRRVWYKLKGEPELGYYLPQGRTQAILVWKIRYMSYRDVTSAVQGGDSGMLIDAVTGDQIPTPTVP